jgi:hypothetical protein
MHCVHLVNTHVDLAENMMDGLRDKATVLIVAQVAGHCEGLSSASLHSRQWDDMTITPYNYS